MMKLFMLFIFVMIMPYFNLMLFFYYNICYISSFLMLFMYSIWIGNYWINMSTYFACDSYSYVLVLLSLWIISLMFMSLNNNELMLKFKIELFIIILIVLMMYFMSFNLMILYLSFEISLIPTFFIVLFWGNNKERLQASFYLLIYMMFISLPLLIYVIKIFKMNFTMDMNLMKMSNVNLMENNMGIWDFLIIFTAFFIKLPIYLFHMWLPKAHVEAPVYGSMLLAAILLKLGGYGLIRLTMMFLDKCNNYSFMIISLGMVGSLYVSMICLIQVDMKMLIAYSSIVHMNFMLCSLFTLMKFGLTGTMIMMISHGLCSSGLFYSANLFYKRSFSRLIMFNKGYINMIPSIGTWWFLLNMSNFSFPFSMNFFSEIMIISVLMSWELKLMFFIMFICFFSGAYSLYLFSIIYHGKFMDCNKMMDKSLVIEHLVMFLHYIPLFLLLFNLYMYY